MERQPKIQCIWEHNGNDTLLYAGNMIGAFTRGDTKDNALMKMADEILAYERWREGTFGQDYMDFAPEITVVQEKTSELNIRDADSDVLFESEKAPLSEAEYRHLKALVLKSAQDFLALYESFPDKNKSVRSERTTFYGQVPRTAEEMYQHTKNVNAYYFGELDIPADNEGTIYECRVRGFEALERQADYLANPVIEGSFGEAWSLRKMLRRFLWHDRIHAKAMYRTGIAAFGKGEIPDIFRFEG